MFWILVYRYSILCNSCDKDSYWIPVKDIQQITIGTIYSQFTPASKICCIPFHWTNVRGKVNLSLQGYHILILIWICQLKSWNFKTWSPFLFVQPPIGTYKPWRSIIIRLTNSIQICFVCLEELIPSKLTGLQENFRQTFQCLTDVQI